MPNNLYHYDPETSELIGSEEAQPDPMAGVKGVPEDAMLVPGYATVIAPPEAKGGFARVFVDGGWSEVEDHRGKPFWTPEGVQQPVTELGPVPVDLLVEKPVLPIYPTLALAQAAMLAWINDFAAGVDAGMPEAELRSLPVKAAAARAHEAGEATAEQIAMLQSEADLTGETVDALADEIIVNANAADQVAAKISGLRRALNKQLKEAADAFEYDVILDVGKAQAALLAGGLGISISG